MLPRMWKTPGILGAMCLFGAPGLVQAWPIQPADWSLDTQDPYGGRSQIENGAMYFWTEEPLAAPAADADDTNFYYYGRHIPSDGAYSIHAVVDLPDHLAQPYDEMWDVTCVYELGIVASGLLPPGGTGEDLPAIHAGVVYEDVTFEGISFLAGDRFVICECGEDMTLIKLGGSAIGEVNLRAFFDGGSRLYFAYRLLDSGPWTQAADYAVEVRPGFSAKAEIRGAASNLLVQASDAGAIVDFWVGPSGDPCDYDGDGLSDIAVYHPAQGRWYILESGAGGMLQRNWGWSEAHPMPGDYDGDGHTDVAVYHPAAGDWYIRESSAGTLRQQNWGWSEAKAVPGDYDGDGRTDVAVYHPAAGNWYILQSGTGMMWQQNWGWSEAQAVPGDYDGDGLTDLAVYHQALGSWYILESGTGMLRQRNWGWSEAQAVPGDYDGDGLTDLAVYHQALGNWYILESGTGMLRQQNWGWSEAQAVPGDYDGDGQTDVAVYHQALGNWYILESSTGTLRFQNWGWSEARPAMLP